MRRLLVSLLLLWPFLADRDVAGEDASMSGRATSSVTSVTPPTLTLSGDWRVQVAVSPPAGAVAAKPTVASVDVTPATIVEVRGEKYARLPLFDAKKAGWTRGAVLRGVAAQECSNRGLLDPGSLQVRTGPGPDAPRLELGRDFAADLEWGTLGRLPNGRIGENQPVYVDYRHGLPRIDSIVFTRDGRIVLRPGRPHAAAPLPPDLEQGERRLANVWLPARIQKLTADSLFPVLETAYPERPSRRPRRPSNCCPRPCRNSAGARSSACWPGATA